MDITAFASVAVLVIIGSIATSGLAMAHHSSAMFDKNLVRQEAATVREFQWTNPHVWIQINIENDDGVREEWSIEFLGPNTLFRNGWRPNTFKPDDVIDIKFNPMLDGSKAGFFVGAKFSSGDTLGNW